MWLSRIDPVPALMISIGVLVGTGADSLAIELEVHNDRSSLRTVGELPY
jgi:hypothetical protein